MRFFNEIDDGIKSGLKRFYLYGKQTKDEIFHNGQGETHGLVESIAFQLLRKDPKHVDKVLVLGGKTARIISKTLASINIEVATNIRQLMRAIIKNIETGIDPLSNITPKAKPIIPDNSNSDDSESDTTDNSTDNVNFFVSCLNAINDEADRVEGSIAIIFDNFHWQTKLFSQQQHEFDLLKQALFFGSNSSFAVPPLCFYILDKLDLLSEYAGEVDKTGSDIFIGLPDVEENKDTLCDYFDDYYSIDTLTTLAKTGRNAQQNLRSIINIVHDLHKNKTPEDELQMQFSDRVNFHLDNVNWDSIQLNRNIKKAMQDFFANLETENKSSLLGIILHGPSGTGKTTIAKVLSNTQDRTLVTAQISDLKGEYIGQSAPKMRRLFDNVRSASPSILFLDEIETIFPSRVGNSGDSYTNDLVTQFLSESDGVFSNNKGVVIVGATNHIDRVDPAVMSRLRSILIDLPSANCRAKILTDFLSDTWLQLSNKSQTMLVKKTHGCSGRDLKTLLSAELLDQIKKGVNANDAAQSAIDHLKQNIGVLLQQGSTGFRLKSFHQNNPNWQNVIGYEQIKNVFNNEVKAILNPGLYDAVNKRKQPHHQLNADNGFLLYGDPGNGKTFLASCMASQFSRDMIEVNVANVLSGASDPISNLNEIFDKVIRYSTIAGGVVLFFDEFDALASQPQFRDTFLKRIDQIRASKTPVILVAATNFIDRLDDAIIRRGRFDQHIAVDNPSSENILELFEYFIDQRSYQMGEEIKAYLLRRFLQEQQNCSISFIKNKAILLAKYIFHQTLTIAISSDAKVITIEQKEIDGIFSIASSSLD